MRVLARRWTSGRSVRRKENQRKGQNPTKKKKRKSPSQGYLGGWADLLMLGALLGGLARRRTPLVAEAGEGDENRLGPPTVGDHKVGLVAAKVVLGGGAEGGLEHAHRALRGQLVGETAGKEFRPKDAGWDARHRVAAFPSAPR